VSRYLYQNLSSGELDRLHGLEAIEDPKTIECLEVLNPVDGMSCLEVGAGAGSVARWLADRVKPSGSVIATDTDVSFLDATAYRVWEHNLRTDVLPAETFDLVHIRHVLIHIPEREHASVLRKLYESLKSGGRILIEESDLLSWEVDSQAPSGLAQRFRAGVDRTLTCYRSRDMLVDLGARLEALLSSSGFVVRRSWRRWRSVMGGSPEAMYQRATALQLRRSIEDRDETLNDFAQLFANQALSYRSRTTVSVFAHKP